MIQGTRVNKYLSENFICFYIAPHYTKIAVLLLNKHKSESIRSSHIPLKSDIIYDWDHYSQIPAVMNKIKEFFRI